MKPHINDGFKIEATYLGTDPHGNHILEDITGDLVRGHGYLNGERSNFPGPEYPGGIKKGSRIRFFCCLFPRQGGARITDCRDVKVIA